MNFQGVPDLVVEVLSPRTRRLDLGVKLAAYRDAGVPEVWFADPQPRTISVHGLSGDGKSYVELSRGAVGESVVSRLLPGLRLAVSKILSLKVGSDPLAPHDHAQAPTMPLRRITRNRRLSPKEAAKYREVRKQVAEELPDLIARHHAIIRVPTHREPTHPRFFGTSADFWMNLQLRWDLYQASVAEADELRQIRRHTEQCRNLREFNLRDSRR
ncbi:MAG TPA: Uma2 family endonuclease [Thermoanaerobaculia bacterium]